MGRTCWACLTGAVLAVLAAGCNMERRTDADSPPAVAVSGPQAVVDAYLKAAAEAEGPGMYALIASSERDDESPTTLADTARDRYAAGMSWKVLKAEEAESTARVIVEFTRAKVDPNPYTFTLTREAGEWRIVQSPELHEEDKDGGLTIKF